MFKRALRFFCSLLLGISFIPVLAYGDNGFGFDEDETLPDGSNMTVDAEAFTVKDPRSVSVDDVRETEIEEFSQAKEGSVFAMGVVGDDFLSVMDAEVAARSSGNGPEESWRFHNGEPIDPGSMITADDVDAIPAAIAEGQYTTYEVFGRGYCSGSGAARGVDVSRWQGWIDWRGVKDSGINFALIRCGYGDNLSSQDDEYFKANVQGCLRYGIPFGVYLYSYATNAGSGNEGALSEANHVLRCLREAGLSPSQLSLPIYLDMEHEGTTWAASRFYDIANVFCSTLQGAGYSTGIYASTSWWNSYLTNSGFSRWSRWIAQYNTSRGLEHPFRQGMDIWQFSSKGRIAGISGYADLDYSYMPAAYGKKQSDYKLVYDFASYKRYNPSLNFKSEEEGFAHFLATGMSSGLRASEIFDPSYYRNSYADLRVAYGETWASYYDHFIKAGASEGRIGSIEFSLASYYNANPDLRAAFGLKPLSYYTHYVVAGKTEGRTKEGCSNAEDMQAMMTVYGKLDYASVYDGSYYLAHNEDIKAAFTKDLGQAGKVIDDAGVLSHFVNWGSKEGRLGSADFDYMAYAANNPDLRAAFGTNVSSYYDHYLNYGRFESPARQATGSHDLRGSVNSYKGKDYSPIYDSAYYIANNQDVADYFAKPFGKYRMVDEGAVIGHFVNQGMKEGRQGCATFDVASYFNANPDLRAAFGADTRRLYEHYLNYGRSEEARSGSTTGVSALMSPLSVHKGKDYSPIYDFATYAQENGDVLEAFTSRTNEGKELVDDAAVLAHFVNWGTKEGRASSLCFSWAYYRDHNVDLQKAFGGNISSYYFHYLDYGRFEGRAGAAAA